MAKLINGNGNPAIYAAEDADLIASLAGNVTCIANVGNKYAATEEDATTIRLDDGVIITKEGRRIQLEAGESDTFYIPTGTSGQTNYYIIGYKLVQNADSTQVAEQFVQKMNSSSETITEDTFRSGATEVYVSVYRVTQVGFTIDSISGLLPELLDNASIKDNIDQINSDLTRILKRRVLLIGDSYMSGNHATSDTIQSVLEDLLSATCYNKSYGGTGFVLNTDNKKFDNQILDAHNDANIPDDEITDILIAGGYNDDVATTESSYITEINNIKAHCKLYFPNAKVWIAPLLWTNVAFPLVTWEQKFQRLINACKQSGLNYDEYAPDILYRTTGTIYTDGVHPNSVGYKLIGQHFARWMSGNGYCPFYKDAINITIADVTGNLNYTISNGIVRLMITFSGGTSGSYDYVMCAASDLPDVIVPSGRVPAIICTRASIPTLKNICLTPDGIVAPSGYNGDGGNQYLEFVYDFHPYIYG